jgi:hypothetical protein
MEENAWVKYLARKKERDDKKKIKEEKKLMKKEEKKKIREEDKIKKDENKKIREKDKIKNEEKKREYQPWPKYLERKKERDDKKKIREEKKLRKKEEKKKEEKKKEEKKIREEDKNKKRKDSTSKKIRRSKGRFRHYADALKSKGLLDEIKELLNKRDFIIVSNAGMAEKLGKRFAQRTPSTIYWALKYVLFYEGIVCQLRSHKDDIGKTGTLLFMRKRKDGDCLAQSLENEKDNMD